MRDSSMGLMEWVTLLLLSAIWGGSFFLGKIAIEEVSPFAVVFSRVALASLVLGLLAFATKQLPPFKWALWREFFLLGLINNAIPFCLIFWGQQYIASGLASIMNATTPLFSALFVHWLRQGERLHFWRLTGVLIGFGGVVVLIGPSALTGIDDHFAGEIAIIGAAISYALGAIYARRFRQLPLMQPVVGQVTTASILVLPIWLVIDRPWNIAHAPSPSILYALLFLGLVCTAFAYLLYFRLIAKAGATNTVLVTFLVPVSAILLGHFILGEVLSANHFVGMTLIFAGLAAIDGRILHFVRKRA